MAPRPYIDKVCESCGTMMRNVPCNKKYCRACLKEKAKKNEANRVRKLPSGTKNDKGVKSGLKNDANAAVSLGMSYGYYSLMKSKEKKR